MKEWKTKPDPGNGLLLVIDPGVSLVGQLTGNTVKPQNDIFGTVFIHTIYLFYDVRAGNYALQSLKKMTGTTPFLGLPNDQKGCQTENYEQCVEKTFRENVFTS